MTTATQRPPLTNKFAGRCGCGQDVPAGGGGCVQVDGRWAVRCGKCLGWPQPARFKRGSKVRVKGEPDIGEVALRCEAPLGGARPMLIVKFPTVGSRPAKSMRVPEDDCSPAEGGQAVVSRQVERPTPQSDLLTAAEDVVADAELAATQRVEMPDYLVEALARLDKAIRRVRETIK